MFQFIIFFDRKEINDVSTGRVRGGMLNEKGAGLGWDTGKSLPNRPMGQMSWDRNADPKPQFPDAVRSFREMAVLFFNQDDGD